MLWLVIFPKKSRILESGQKGHLVLSAKIFLQECIIVGTFLAAQWLRFHTLTAEELCSIPGQGTRIPEAKQCDQKKKKRFNVEYVQIYF